MSWYFNWAFVIATDSPVYFLACFCNPAVRKQKTDIKRVDFWMQWLMLIKKPMSSWYAQNQTYNNIEPGPDQLLQPSSQFSL